MKKQAILVLLMLLLVLLDEVGGFLSLFRSRSKKRRKSHGHPKEFLRDLKALEKTIKRIHGMDSRKARINNPDNCDGRSHIPRSSSQARHYTGNHGYLGSSLSPQYTGYPSSGHARHSFVGYDHGILHGKAPIYGPVYFHGVSNLHHSHLSGGHYHWYPDHHHEDHVLGYRAPIAAVENIYPLISRKDEASSNLFDQHLESETFDDDMLYSHEHEIFDEDSSFERDFPVEILSDPHDFYPAHRRTSNTSPNSLVKLSSDLHSSADEMNDHQNFHSLTREAFHDPVSSHEMKNKGHVFSSKNTKTPLSFSFFGHQMKAAGTSNALVLHTEDLPNKPEEETTSMSSYSHFDVSSGGNSSMQEASDWKGYAWEPSQWRQLDG